MYSKKLSHARLDILLTYLKRFVLLTVLIVSVSCNYTHAQCTSDKSGFPPVDSLPCITIGQSTDLYIPYKCFDNILLSFTDTTGRERLSDKVFEMRIESISNIPCGLSLDVNSSNNPLILGQTACLHLHGTATDSVGFYQLNIVISFKLLESAPGYTNLNVPLEQITPMQPFMLRLVSTGDSCMPVLKEDILYPQTSHCN